MDGAIHSVTITGYNSDGEGVSRLEDGRVAFVRGAARGDVLEIVLVKDQQRVAWAEIVRVITPSPYRIEPDCSVYPECGGCDYRHVTYEEELDAKKQCVNDALQRIGGLSVLVDQVLHSGKINGYRNKAVLHSDGASLGFYRARSHDVIPVEHCLLLKDDLNCSLKDLIQTGATSDGVTLRSGRNGVGDRGTVLLSQNGEKSSKLVRRTVPLSPSTEELDGLIFKVEGFFQVNTDAALLLFQKAREYAALSKADTFVDLYCGVGALTLFVGRDAGYALGVEQNQGAVRIARENAERNGFSHIEFINADAAEWVADVVEPDCVIVDPPRKGLSQGAINKIFELSPKRLVYISCNPATLARDLKVLTGGGKSDAKPPEAQPPSLCFKVSDICAVDMFPRTANIECCCLLVKE